MKASKAHVSMLRRISSVVSSGLSLEEMLGEVVGFAIQVTACDACLVYLVDRNRDEVVLRASQMPHSAALGNVRMKVGEGVTGRVAEHRSVVILASNASSDPRFRRFPALIEDTYQAFLSVPLVSGGEVAGVINVHHRQPRQLSAAEVSTMIFLGEQLGVAVSKSLLLQEKGRLVEELETRDLLQRAKAILQRKFGISEEEAYLRLRKQSRKLRLPMKKLAEAVLLTEELNPQSEPSGKLVPSYAMTSVAEGA